MEEISLKAFLSKVAIRRMDSDSYRRAQPSQRLVQRGSDHGLRHGRGNFIEQGENRTKAALSQTDKFPDGYFGEE
jgi:hypothetical protein